MNFRISDLKRVYQRNTMIGFIATGILFCSVFALASTLSREYKQPVENIIVDYLPDTLVVMPPVPPSPTKTIDVKTEPPPEPPEIGIIIAVNDTLATDAGQVPTQNQIISWVPDQPVFDPGQYASDANIEKVLESLLPKSGTFVPYDEEPVPVNRCTPVYPPIAQRAGIQGTVWLNVLVDKEGKVQYVEIYKDSDADAGFEEAAIDAAYKTSWKPALANGQPVAVWVAYRVDFVLR